MATPTPEVSGLLLVDKPAGITSHDVVAIVRRSLRSRRVGHAGTLDPFATGLLVLLVGRGTRLIQYVDGEPKVYEASICFGAETDTDDLTGAVTRSAPLPNDVALAEGIARLSGAIEQIPPVYSAKQVAGVRAYAAARRGAPLALPAVNVIVHSWTILGRDADVLRVRIACSGGTYVRALARDLGRLADSAAHLTALRRIASGPLSVDDAVPLDRIQSGDVQVRPLRDAIPSLPEQRLDATERARVLHGNTIAARVDGTRVALVDDEQSLIAVAERSDEVLQPTVVLRDG